VSDEHWPQIKVERFDDESETAYRRRRDMIVNIMTGFRLGRYEGETADRLEQRLVALQEGLFDPAILNAA
jgi:hypothetical protein